MSMVQQLITAVNASERQIDEQIGQLTACEDELEQVARKIRDALSGSTQDHERQMLGQMSATMAEIKQSIGMLQTAKGMLARVRMI